MTADAQESGVGRASFLASAATLFSTIIGFARNLALAAAIGTGLVADSYNIANQVPSQIFALLGGGTIAFVFVPQLMRHARTSLARGDEYGSFILFAGAAFGILVTVLLLALSPHLIHWMGGSSWESAQSSLGLRLTLWCIPQVFFFAVYGVASQLMYARGHFAAVAWMPTVNSLAIILSCIPIIVVGTVEANSPTSMSDWEVAVLGGSTLLGSALQSILLVLLLRRAGFRLRPRFQLRGLGLRTTAFAGLLTVAAITCYQTANLVAAALSTRAGSEAKALGYEGRGYTAFFYAQTLSFVAAAVASASLANILLQRLSRHYAEGDRQTASKELNEAILATGALLIPVMWLSICLGPLGTDLLFARGQTSHSAAQYIGVVLAVLSVGLVPHALHEILIRPFYAVHDAKTPLRSAGVVGGVWIIGCIGATVFLPPQHALLGIAGAVSLSYIVDLPLRLRSLNRQLQFKISDAVIRGYRNAMCVGLAAAVVIGASASYLERNIPDHWLPRAILFFGAGLGFLIIYYPLTARGPASLGRLVRWLRT
ncbi:murein biosynthesis integral membrane protein MurJ [Mycolicibacterium sp. D5.8-2]|uniref:murein biosynthesis integral membrane protein MurJ n=1 Tax=Mycolicibacterium sp. D5.8-2 TaxID=3085903 RepID=UPI00298C7D9C|nr:lipid II flippase MurJ [Mycolicibacterium sp. D5.8-2]MDW5612047.1 lipid II flippase MurJ [Mycolicibacterium sp. D5.8-2]